MRRACALLQQVGQDLLAREGAVQPRQSAMACLGGGRFSMPPSPNLDGVECECGCELALQLMFTHSGYLGDVFA